MRDERPGGELARPPTAMAPLTTMGDHATNAGPVPPIDDRSSAEEKLALFRRLFRGRDDVYARGWAQRKGYSPARSGGRLLPLTGAVLLDHLRGKYVVGVYPLLTDNTCWFLAVDFDGDGWLEDVAAFAASCRRFGAPLAVERSRSGNGAHAWFFFAQPVAAAAVRAMGRIILAQTAVRRPSRALASYDRLFPNQDQMPRGGFGNLIALPLQGAARRQGNSVFIDEEGRPYEDQWAFLSRQSLLEQTFVTRLAGEILAPTTAPARPRRRAPALAAPPPAMGTVRGVLREALAIEKAGVPATVATELKRLAAFSNPEFYKRQKRRLTTAFTAREIRCFEDHPDRLVLPRGCVEEVRDLLVAHGASIAIDDQRGDGRPVAVRLRATLQPEQHIAANALLARDMGVLVAPPGFGKTVVAAALVARRGRNTLVMVHRAQLADQWISKLASHLEIDASLIGRIGGGKRKPTGHIDVATFQSLVRKGRVDPIVGEYGHVIVDECHHVPAFTFERLLGAVRARYVTGLTATPRRRDGHHPIIEMQLGPIRFSVDNTRPVGERHMARRLIVRQSSFSEPLAGASIQEIYNRLANDEARNHLILGDVLTELEDGRVPLVLTERREHLERLAALIRQHCSKVIVLHGTMSGRARAARDAQLADLSGDDERVVIATGAFAGEGFDDARLDTLVLALPVSWQGKVVQYAGRIYRAHRDKTECRVYDYVDADIPELMRMFESRRAGYRSMGYTEEGYRDGSAEHAVPPQLALDFDHQRRAVLRVADSCSEAAPAMGKPASDEELDAMIDDVTIEAFTPTEKASAFLDVLQSQLALPLRARIGEKELVVESLRVSDDDVVAVCPTAKRRRYIPLAKVQPPRQPPIGWEWVDAYARWARTRR